MINKYVGRRVEVIYQDGKGKISQRVVMVQSVADGRALVFDVNKGSVRTLRLDGILAAMPVRGRRPA